MSTLEIIGVVTGSLSVWYATRQNWLTWPLSIVNLVAFVVMFAGAKLYADVLLHVCYLGLSVYGWMNWGVRREVPVRAFDTHLLEFKLSIVAFSWFVMGYLFVRFTDADYPGSDSLVTVLSLWGCYLLSRKDIGCWIIYIISDIIAISIYLAKGLNLTAALYAFYLILCIKGYRDWRKELTCV